MRRDRCRCPVPPQATSPGTGQPLIRQAVCGRDQTATGRAAGKEPAAREPGRIAISPATDSRPERRPLHTYFHADAIDDGVLADYQLLVPTITDTELRFALTDPEAGPTARRTTALHLAIIKAMREHDLKHVIVYFQQIADAADFARQFPHTLRSLPDEMRPDWAGELSVQSIDGTDNLRRRADILTRFDHAGRAVLANAKVLSEGVDLPAVDGIVFADRTASVRRIVQALGRALRKPPTQHAKIVSLVIPAYIPPGADPTDLLGTPYEPLWLVTAALRHHDQTIAARALRAKSQH